MTLIKRVGILSMLILFLSVASFAEIRVGGETTIGLASSKLFSTDESRYLYPIARTLGSWRLSMFVGLDTADEESKFSVGFEQHAGLQLASLFNVDHLPLIFSLPSRVYFRIGSEEFAFMVLAGIDNQLIATGSANSYPAYSYFDIWTFKSKNYEASPSGYAMGLEIGIRVVIKHSYLTAIAAIPITDNYIFPGFIRLGLGLTF